MPAGMFGGGSVSMHDTIAQQAAAADASGPDPSAVLSVEHHPEGGVGGQWRPDPAALQSMLRAARGTLLYVGEPLQGGIDAALPPTVSLRLNIGSMDRSRTEDCMASDAPVIVVVAFPSSAEQRSAALKHVRGSQLHGGRVPGVSAAEPALLAADAKDTDAAALLSVQLAGVPYGVYQLDPRAYPHKDTYDPELPFPQYMLFHLVGRLLPAGPWGMKGMLEPYAPAPQAAVVCAASGCDVVYSFEGHAAVHRGYRHQAGGSSKGTPPKKASAKATATDGSSGPPQATLPFEIAQGSEAVSSAFLSELSAGTPGAAAAFAQGGQGGSVGMRAAFSDPQQGGDLSSLSVDLTEDFKVSGWLARQPEETFRAALRLFVTDPANKTKLVYACNARIFEQRCLFSEMLRWLFESACEGAAADPGFAPLVLGVTQNALQYKDTAAQMSGKAEQDILVQAVQRGASEDVLCSMVTQKRVVLQNVPSVWATLEQCVRSAAQPGVFRNKASLFMAMLQLAATQVGCLERFVTFCVADTTATSVELAERLDILKLFVNQDAPAQRGQVLELLKQPSLKNNVAAAQLLASFQGESAPSTATALHDDDEGGYCSDGSL